MPRQARAEATRRRIIDSAVDLFTEMGYGETGLADVLQRAGVSKGAFYYHFDSKESVAAAIITEYRDANAEAVLARIDLSAPLLERIIVASFISAALIHTEKSARIGNELMQALSQISGVASLTYRQWTDEFIANLTRAINAAGVSVDATELANAAWAGVLGSHLLASALGDDPYPRLAVVWRSIVRAAIPESSVSEYEALIDTTVSNLRGLVGAQRS